MVGDKIVGTYSKKGKRMLDHYLKKNELEIAHFADQLRKDHLVHLQLQHLGTSVVAGNCLQNCRI